MKIKVMMFLVALLLVGGILYAANGDLTVNGTLNVGAAGVKFPDGSTQTTAASQISRQANSAPWFGTPTGSRAYNTVYQNLTGKPIFIAITATNNTGGASITLSIDSSSNPSTTITVMTVQANGYYVTVLGVILPNYYYKAVWNAGSPSAPTWVEWN